MKTGAFWAIASALFLISGALIKDNNICTVIAFGYSFLAAVKAGFEA